MHCGNSAVIHKLAVSVFVTKSNSYYFKSRTLWQKFVDATFFLLSLQCRNVVGAPCVCMCIRCNWTIQCNIWPRFLYFLCPHSVFHSLFLVLFFVLVGEGCPLLRVRRWKKKTERKENRWTITLLFLESEWIFLVWFLSSNWTQAQAMWNVQFHNWLGGCVWIWLFFRTSEKKMRSEMKAAKRKENNIFLLIFRNILPSFVSLGLFLYIYVYMSGRWYAGV